MAKFGRVLTYKDVEEAKQYIGKKCYTTSILKYAEGWQQKDTENCFVQKLVKVIEGSTEPFVSGKLQWQFLVPIIEDDEKSMSDYKVGILYDPDNKYKAEQYLGTKGFFSNYYPEITDFENMNSRCVESTLKTIDCNTRFPFTSNYGGHFLFFRPILEEKPRRMTWAEIIEWSARGNGMISFDCTRIRLCWTVSVSCYENEINKEVGEKVRIRHFGTDEILVPTREIFIKDCRS